MKKRLLAIGMILTLLLAGCKGTGGNGGSSDNDGNQQVVLDFERMDYYDLDENIRMAIDESKSEKGHLVLSADEEFSYLVVFAGEKATGGYGIEIVKLENSDGKTFVTIKESSPEPGSMVTQAITYPLDIVKVASLEEEIVIVYEEKDGDSERVGQIVEFGDNEVHIIFGDVVEIFEVENGILNDFYLLETVSISEGEEGKYTLQPYLVKDFSIRHTNMGHVITTVDGSIASIDGESMTVSTESGDLTFKTYGETNYTAGENVIVDYFKVDPSAKDNILIAVYRTELTLDLTVESFSRSDNGRMSLRSRDAEDMEYVVYLSNGTVVNFNLSEISQGDEIKVYYEAIMESYPMQVDALMIEKH